jgi:hypothetical protein
MPRDLLATQPSGGAPRDLLATAPPATAAQYDAGEPSSLTSSPAQGASTPPVPIPGEQALEGMPGWERALVGAGKAFSDTWHGVKQLGAEAANAVSPSLISDETVRDLRAEADETKKRDQALMDDTAGRAGNIGGHVAMGIALPAKRILTAIGSAAGYGAAQPVGTEESRTENAAVSGVAGGAAGVVAKGVGRALKPVRSEVSRGIGHLMDKAENMGFKLSAGQRTGSRHLQNAEAALDTLPTSGSPLGKYRDHNQQTANRIVAKEMGETGDAVTPEVIEGARTRIGGVMDGLTKGRQFDVDHKFFDDVFRIRAQYGQTLKGQQSAQIRSMIDELAAGSKLRKPQITAEQYQRTASELKQEAEAAFRSGAGVADAKVKRDIAEALEGLAERNFTGAEREAFQQARRQYSATLIAEKAVRPDGSGDIMIGKVAGATKKHRRIATRHGTTDELVDLGRLGQGLQKQLIPNSGTAERSWWLQALQNPIGHAGLGYAGLGPVGAIGALSTPWLAGRAMYSGVGQKWLRNGVPNTNLLREALLRTGPGAATGLVASEGSAR